MVFQNYALYPHMTVYKNIAFGLIQKKVPKDEIDNEEVAGGVVQHLGGVVLLDDAVLHDDDAVAHGHGEPKDIEARIEIAELMGAEINLHVDYQGIRIVLVVGGKGQLPLGRRCKKVFPVPGVSCYAFPSGKGDDPGLGQGEQLLNVARKVVLALAVLEEEAPPVSGPAASVAAYHLLLHLRGQAAGILLQSNWSSQTPMPPQHS